MILANACLVSIKVKIKKISLALPERTAVMMGERYRNIAPQEQEPKYNEFRYGYNNEGTK